MEIWWQILKHLSRNTVYNLVLALKDLANADEGSRGKMAAYWLSEFFSVFKNSANPVSSDIETLNPNQLPDKSKLQLLVENVCLNPSKTTVHYLPRSVLSLFLSLIVMVKMSEGSESKRIRG